MMKLTPQPLRAVADASVTNRLVEEGAEGVLSPLLAAQGVDEVERAALVQRMSQIVRDSGPRGPRAVAEAVLRELVPDAAQRAALITDALWAVTQGAVVQPSVEALLEQRPPERESPPSVDDFEAFEAATGDKPRRAIERAFVAKIGSGERSLEDAMKLSARLATELKLDLDPLYRAIGSQVVKMLASRNHTSQPVKVEQLATLVQQHPKDEVLRSCFVALMDRSTLEGKEPPYPPLAAWDSRKPVIPNSIWKPYVARLAEAHPSASEQGAKVAAGLAKLEQLRFLPASAIDDYLHSDPKIAAAEERFALRKREPFLKGGSGSAIDGETRFVPRAGGHQSTSTIALVDARGGETTFASTGKFAPYALALRGGEVLAIENNNNVAYLEVYGRGDGRSLRRTVLPRPVHHVSSHSIAVSDQGRLVYASSDSKSRDLLVSMDPDFDPKDPKRAENLVRDTVLAPSGYKFKAVAVEGDYAFAALVHDGKRSLKIMRYRLPNLSAETELLGHAPIAGYPWVQQMMLIGDRIVVASHSSLLVLDRRGDQVKLAGSLPFESIDDLRLRNDGGADMVVSGNLIALSADDVRVLFLDPMRG
jgi:hypothetical protein